MYIYTYALANLRTNDIVSRLLEEVSDFEYSTHYLKEYTLQSSTASKFG